jgi:hypothetical protein
MEGMSPAPRLARLTGAFLEAGGAGAKTLIRRVWLGDLRTDLIDAQRQVYDSYAGSTAAFGDDQTVTSVDPAELAGQLDQVVRECGADSLNLRIHLPGMPPEAVRDQIVRLGSDVLPRLRTLAHGRPWS